jgi:serine/threonine-protein kinase
VTASEQILAAALPSYRIGQVIGQGGYGVVRFGRHRNLDRPVAVKQIPTALVTDPEVRARFAEEAQTLASFDNPHIVRLYDYVEQDELCLLVLEYLPGGTLADAAADPGFTWAGACATAMVTCAGLHYAHQHKVLHRDVKPENALYTGEGVLKVTDFGIAKVVGGRDVLTTRAGEILGTPAFIAPEQAGGGVLGPPADVYATGVMLYEMLSGQLPFSSDGGSLTLIIRHVSEDPRPLTDVAPDLPRSIADVVMQSLAREPEERFPTAEAFGVAVAEAAGRSFGPSWLDQAEVKLLAPGAILESAKRVGAGPSGPPLGNTPRIRRTVPPGEHVGKPRVSDLEAEELVPVRQVLEPPRPPRFAAAVTATLVGATVLAAVVGLGTPPAVARPLPPGTVSVQGADVSAGGTAQADLSTAVPVRIRTRAARTVRQAVLRMDVLGVPLIREPRGVPVRNGRAQIPAQSVRFAVAGPVAAELEFRDATGRPVLRHPFVLTPTTGGFLSIPGALTVGLLLFLVAYSEAAVRPMWRRGRRTITGVLRMAFLGAGFGVSAVLLAWLAGRHPVDLTTTTTCAILGAGAGIASAVTVAAQGRRVRARRVRSPEPATPQATH